METERCSVPDDIEVNPQLTLPEREISFETSTSSGPGGQNVNKVETRVTLLFDLGASDSLAPEQKERIRERLATRINKAGVLRVVSQKHRSQSANRQVATERFAALLAEALEETPPRKTTRPSRTARRRRLQNKRRRSEIKKLRKPPRRED
jgi:ribosome-associated protein